MNQAQKSVATHHPDQHQCRAYNAARDQRSVYPRFHFIEFFRAEIIRYDYGAPDITAESKGDKNQRDFITVPHGGKRAVTDKFPRHKTIGYII